ncbi:hypothetical protein LJU02_05215 [Corynebacterium pseudotuberculosis]|uniref:FCS-type domain-containing protein n=2 Tax=Corynebacterium pseudotuberculosis TaxID=1719 RepID=D9QAB4_CORP2|nr:hypothetical protein [Corynebacterium pseudotuberculosis]ADL10490.1 hypothetical protein CPC231_05125 [Corynebacterium pseudotuberculosis C231]ADL20899.2 hypothetical protein CP1002_08025 [Corynebacterium pseudotuberculosis 1002]ADO26287.1 hypothetical protein CPI19_06395 [Corynebacterium pseudotuberculosis I19]AEK92348.1 Hypothetical protein CpPAT10_1013 [Corynebacterium pseudotuberculosis PAT10]AEP70262.1 Hypothetical protein Cp4202_1006 [Corynebacterium pseudotuberculosis 42/02-A]
MSNLRVNTCAWCGKEFASPGRGRPKKFCSHSCRQRAYEQRTASIGPAVPENAVVLRPERVSELRDSLFELRCAAEDIATASSEGADPMEMQQLCSELVVLAKQIEKLR